MGDPAIDAIVNGRAFAVHKAPYFASILYGLTPYAKKNFGTIGVTKGLVLIYDPDLIPTWTMEEVAGALTHEAMHVISDHAFRGESYDDKDTWNEACDCSFNPSLLDAGWKMPFYIVPDELGLKPGLTADEYYEALLKKKQQQQSKSGKQGKPQSGNQTGKGGGSGQPGQQPGNKTMRGRCGGGAGNPIDSELEAQVDAEVGRSEVEQKRIQLETQEEVKKHIAQQGRGSVPSFLTEFLKRMEQASKIRWQNKFASILRKATGRVEAGGNDFSLSRLSNRTYTRGIIRPSLVQQRPIILFVLDTSGSMGTDDLALALREASAIIRQLGIDDAYLLQVDAHVHGDKPQRVSVSSLAALEIKGRGGTDFRPAFAAAQKMKPKPDILVYLTDGDGYAPEFPPGDMEVVWCITPNGYTERPAAWGHIVKVERDDA